MNSYKAISKDKASGIFLSKDDQVDEFLKKGYYIYETSTDKDILVATPDKGRLMDIEVEEQHTASVEEFMQLLKSGEY